MFIVPSNLVFFIVEVLLGRRESVGIFQPRKKLYITHFYGFEVNQSIHRNTGSFVVRLVRFPSEPCPIWEGQIKTIE